MSNIFDNNTEDMSRNFEAFGSNNSKIAIGNLDYIGEKISVFSVSDFIKKEEVVGTIRIESKVNYEEVYSALVDRIEGNKIFLFSLRNISDELKEDIKIDYSRIIEIKCKRDEEEKTIEARMMDISSGGIGFTAKETFEVGEILKVDTKISEIGFEPNIKILRREKMGRLLKYGCRFVDLSLQEESKIRKAVYQLQIKVHRTKVR
ncbi:MAG: PilZ domain-containing protein [Peptostreptococcaceae bacterium]|nr:PilZ domain-containing protein [Peptostreptococcaceae bacterium]